MTCFIRFGKISVTCEGYDHPNDDYVLAGSCGLEYDLDITEEGKRFEKSAETVLLNIFALLLVLFGAGCVYIGNHLPHRTSSGFFDSSRRFSKKSSSS